MTLESTQRRRRRRRRRREWSSKTDYDRSQKNESSSKEYPKGGLLSYGKNSEEVYESSFTEREVGSSLAASEEGGGVKRHPRKGWWQRLIKK